MKTFLLSFIGAICAFLVVQALPRITNPERDVVYRIRSQDAMFANWDKDPKPAPSSTPAPNMPQAHGRIRMPDFPPHSLDKIIEESQRDDQ